MSLASLTFSRKSAKRYINLANLKRHGQNVQELKYTTWPRARQFNVSMVVLYTEGSLFFFLFFKEIISSQHPIQPPTDLLSFTLLLLAQHFSLLAMCIMHDLVEIFKVI